MFGARGKKKKEAVAAQKQAEQLQVAQEQAFKDAERSKVAAERTTGADHMARAQSKFSGGAPKAKRWERKTCTYAHPFINLFTSSAVTAGLTEAVIL